MPKRRIEIEAKAEEQLVVTITLKIPKSVLIGDKK